MWIYQIFNISLLKESMSYEQEAPCFLAPHNPLDPHWTHERPTFERKPVHISDALDTFFFFLWPTFDPTFLDAKTYHLTHPLTDIWTCKFGNQALQDLPESRDCLLEPFINDHEIDVSPQKNIIPHSPG